MAIRIRTNVTTWSTYEPHIEGEYNINEMHALYENTVNHDEYPSFGGWLWDMERSATFFCHER